MEPITDWLTPEMTLHEAIRVMHRVKRGHGLSVNGIVVLDGVMKIVGIVSTTDILRAIMVAEMFLDDELSEATLENLRRDCFEKTRQMHVSSIMTEDVRVIRSSDSIMRCADILLVEQVRRLPVVAMDGKVVGTVYLRDVYNAVTRLLCETESQAFAS
jgi:CBS domain-containing protein